MFSQLSEPLMQPMFPHLVSQLITKQKGPQYLVLLPINMAGCGCIDTGRCMRRLPHPPG